jgi:hypothetical protein
MRQTTIHGPGDVRVEAPSNAAPPLTQETTLELKTVNATVKTPARNFTGDVYMTPIYNGTGPSRMTVALVRFTPGAHTNWHSHAVGQTLHVTEGADWWAPATARCCAFGPATRSPARPARNTGTAPPPTPS